MFKVLLRTEVFFSGAGYPILVAASVGVLKHN